MSTIQVGGQLQPGTVDTPLDARVRVDTLSAIASIPLPFVGMTFFVKATGRLYVVKSLKSKQIGPVVTENAAIDEYQEIGAGAAGKPDRLVLIRPVHSSGLFPVVDAYPDSTLSEDDRISVCDEGNYTGVAFWNGEAWSATGENGIPAACGNLPVEIDISGLAFASGYFVYRWVDSSGYSSDALSLPFPAVVEPTPFQLNAVTASGNGLKIRTLSYAEYSMLLEPDPATLYFIQGVGLMFNGEKYYSEQNEEVTQ